MSPYLFVQSKEITSHEFADFFKETFREKSSPTGASGNKDL